MPEITTPPLPIAVPYAFTAIVRVLAVPPFSARGRPLGASPGGAAMPARRRPAHPSYGEISYGILCTHSPACNNEWAQYAYLQHPSLEEMAQNNKYSGTMLSIYGAVPPRTSNHFTLGPLEAC